MIFFDATGKRWRNIKLTAAGMAVVAAAPIGLLGVGALVYQPKWGHLPIISQAHSFVDEAAGLATHPTASPTHSVSAKPSNKPVARPVSVIMASTPASTPAVLSAQAHTTPHATPVASATPIPTTAPGNSAGHAHVTPGPHKH